MFRFKLTEHRAAIGTVAALTAMLAGGAVAAKDLTMGTTSPDVQPLHDFGRDEQGA